MKAILPALIYALMLLSPTLSRADKSQTLISKSNSISYLRSKLGVEGWARCVVINGNLLDLHLARGGRDLKDELTKDYQRNLKVLNLVRKDFLLRGYSDQTLSKYVKQQNQLYLQSTDEDNQAWYSWCIQKRNEAFIG